MAIEVIYPDWHGVPANIGALSTMRIGGVSSAPYDDGKGGGGLNVGTHVGDDLAAITENRARLRQLLPAEPSWLNQVHGSVVVDAAKAAGSMMSADASIATTPGVVCAIQTADCLPVLFADVAGKVVGAAHAGWRGLAAGVLENTLAAMREAGATEVIAWMGPAIGPNAFEVGGEVREAFFKRLPSTEKAFTSHGHEPEKFFADIYLLASLLLVNAGVTKIHGGAFCTVGDQDRFYSYRRDKQTGRMASCIWLKSQ